jgi:uncharacterized protein (DUF58 family)
MIAPHSRLLYWTAAITLPATLITAAVPQAALLCIVVTAGFAAAAIVDAVLARRSLIGIGVETPTVVRMSKDREAKLDVRVENASQHSRRLQIALHWPVEVQPSVEEQDVLLPAGSKWSQLAWSCLPGRRGNYRIGEAFVQSLSPLGFWSIRERRIVKSELRVYPNLLTERRSLAALFLNRGNSGVHAHRQVGRGRDFEKLREYVPGDGYDEIHWKATARRARPITKVFQIERTQEIYVAVDASRLSSRQLEDANQNALLERMVTAALVVGLATEKQGDLFGLITFSDRVEKFIRARNGKAHYGHCRDALYTLQARPVTPDFDEVCSFMRLRLRRRALILFLTSLDDPAIAESFIRSIDLVSRQHVVVVNMIRQPTTAPLFTGTDPDSADDLYAKLGGHLQWHKLRQVQKTLQRRGVGFSELDNERFSADVVSQYLAVKQRQLI